MEADKSKISPEKTSKAVCGVVMPISAIDGCPESHWADVLAILSEAIEDAGFDPNLVSNAEDVGIIQKRIIQNLYYNPIVVCDVSAKNPNVMFELGLRLAFDKPTIIVKDDKTSYSFDTGQIEHLQYPRDLRFSKIVDFKEKLSEKIHGTFEKSASDPSYTTFLKHFGAFTVAKLDKKEVSIQEFIMEELKAIHSTIHRLERPQNMASRGSGEWDIDISLRGAPNDEAAQISKILLPNPDVTETALVRHRDHMHIKANLKTNDAEKKQALRAVLEDAVHKAKRVEAAADGKGA